jgi:hypothetical protein
MYQDEGYIGNRENFSSQAAPEVLGASVREFDALYRELAA